MNIKKMIFKRETLDETFARAEAVLKDIKNAPTVDAVTISYDNIDYLRKQI